MTNPYDQPNPAPVQKKRKKWPWILGAIILVIIIAAVAGGGGDENENTATAPSSAPAGAPAPAPAENDDTSTIPPLTAAPQTGEGKTIIYEVISDSGSLNNVTWFDENSAMQQDTNVPAPWTLTVNNRSSFVTAGVTAQTDGTSVTCRVIVDGEVEAEETATGQFAVVNCTAPVF